eukprot:g8371.t1
MKLNRMNIGFMGCQGAHTEDAVFSLFEEYQDNVSVRSVPAGFARLFEELLCENSDLDYAVVPVYTRVGGIVKQSVDLLKGHKHRLQMVPLRVDIPIGQHLLVHPELLEELVGDHRGRAVAAITEEERAKLLKKIAVVRSHPQALKQCAPFLDALAAHVKVEESVTTSTAAMQIVERKEIHAAALAGRRAADIYGLTILKENCQEKPLAENVTRFVLLKKQTGKQEAGCPSAVDGTLADLLTHLQHWTPQSDALWDDYTSSNGKTQPAQIIAESVQEVQHRPIAGLDALDAVGKLITQRFGEMKLVAALKWAKQARTSSTRTSSTPTPGAHLYVPKTEMANLSSIEKLLPRTKLDAAAYLSFQQLLMDTAKLLQQYYFERWDSASVLRFFVDKQRKATSEEGSSAGASHSHSTAVGEADLGELVQALKEAGDAGRVQKLADEELQRTRGRIRTFDAVLCGSLEKLLGEVDLGSCGLAKMMADALDKQLEGHVGGAKTKTGEQEDHEHIIEEDKKDEEISPAGSGSSSSSATPPAAGGAESGAAVVVDLAGLHRCNKMIGGMLQCMAREFQAAHGITFATSSSCANPAKTEGAGAATSNMEPPCPAAWMKMKAKARSSDEEDVDNQHSSKQAAPPGPQNPEHQPEASNNKRPRSPAPSEVVAGNQTHRMLKKQKSVPRTSVVEGGANNEDAMSVAYSASSFTASIWGEGDLMRPGRDLRSLYVKERFGGIGSGGCTSTAGAAAGGGFAEQHQSSSSPAAVLIPNPAEMKLDIRCDRDTFFDVIEHARSECRKILHDRSDPRIVAIVGPCSIHDVKAAHEYAEWLAKEAEKYKEDLLVIMRVYFEKPRSTVGWKGFINDPDLDGTNNIAKGLAEARKLLRDINAQYRLPCATEFLDSAVAPFLSDLVAWGAIGARTTESQTHREMASQLKCPVGFKNGTSGDVQVAVDAVVAGRRAYSLLGVDLHPEEHLYESPGAFQQASLQYQIVPTSGNADGHVVLRGGKSAPNFERKFVDDCVAKLSKLNKDNKKAEDHDRPFPCKLVIDCSHGNSNKDYRKQPVVLQDICAQIAGTEPGEHSILGVMIESNLVAGKQDAKEPAQLEYGKSVTDGCVDVETTAQMLADLAKAVQTARKKNLAASSGTSSGSSSA